MAFDITFVVCEGKRPIGIDSEMFDSIHSSGW